MNIPTKLSEIEKSKMEDLIELPAESFAAILDEINSMKSKADNAKAFIENVLSQKYSETVLKKLSEKDEPFGSVRIEDGEMDVIVTTPKKAYWCAQSIDNISSTLRDWNEDPSEYIETKVSVKESKYKNWPSTIQKLFEPARSVMAGKTSYKFEKGVN